MANKKKKKLPVVLISVLGGVLLLGIFITVRINSYLKSKKTDKVTTAVQEPDINAEERRKGHGRVKGDLIGIFDKRTSQDSILVDSLNVNSDSLDIPLSKQPQGEASKESVSVQENTSKPAKPAAPVTALSSTIEKETQKPQTVSRPAARPKPQKEPEYRDVSFNFHIVKEEHTIEGQPQEVSKTKALDETLVLSEAKIYGDHTLKHMEPVTLRSTERIQINAREYIPEGSLLYGVCRVTANRMEITITRAMTRSGNFPVELEVYDNDFQKGIFIRGHDIDLEPEGNMDEVTTELGNVAFGPNSRVANSVTKAAAKAAQRDLRKMKKASLLVPDGYVVYIYSNVQQNRTR